MKMMRVEFFLLLSLLILTQVCRENCHADAQSIFSEHCEEATNEICINIGGAHETIGKYRGDEAIVRYIQTGRPPFVSRTFARIYNADDLEHAFMRQMEDPEELTFSVNVDLNIGYKLTFGLAEIKRSNCKGKGNIVQISANDEKLSGVSAFREERCNTAHYATIPYVVPKDSGNIIVKVKGTKTSALATLCVEKVNTPRSTESPYPRPKKCPQKGCRQYTGNLQHISVHGSLVGNNYDNCEQVASTASLQLPTGSRVKYAHLSCASGGFPDRATTISFNSRVVSTSRLFFLPFSLFIADADVTDFVKEDGSGTYTVKDVYLDGVPPGTTCGPGMKIAAWALSVVYEMESLPLATIVVCLMPSWEKVNQRCSGVKLSSRSVLTVMGYFYYWSGYLTINGKEYEVRDRPTDAVYQLLPFEFDITNFAQDGVNTLKIKCAHTIFLHNVIIHTY